MSETKFPCAFSSFAGEEIDLPKLLEIHDGSPDVYYASYWGTLLCPECRHARLALVPNAITPHLKSLDPHMEGCSYNYEVASAEELREYREGRANRASIARKLGTLVDSLHTQKHTERVSFRPGERPALSRKQPTPSKHDTPSPSKRIRTKRLTSVLHYPDDFNTPMLFYGAVSAEWDLTVEKRKYLRIRNTKDNRLICSVGMTDNVYSYIDDSSKFAHYRRCYIALFTEMRRKDNYTNCSIGHSGEILIEVH